MGARAVRITREELLTPPEFRGLHPAEHPAGRVGGARIELMSAGGQTCLGRCYQQIPIRVMPPFHLDAEPAALLYLITLTAGLLDGDGHRVELTARRGTRAVVTGQSATRVHPARGRLRHSAVGRGGRGRRLPGRPAGTSDPVPRQPLLPGGRVELAPRARLIWGDIWLPGRYERGALSERFQFDRIVQDFEVRRDGRLVYRDRFRWDGPWTPEDALVLRRGAGGRQSLYRRPVTG